MKEAMPPPDPPESRFVFNSGVVAFGARLDQPRHREVRGAVALPGVGGRVNTQEGELDLDGLVRYRYASSGVSGEGYAIENDQIQYETRATSTLEGMEFAGLVRADFVSATLLSTYVNHHVFREESVTLRGLWVDGTNRRVERRKPHIARGCPTFDELRTRASQPGMLAADLGSLCRPGASEQVLASQSGYYTCYLFDPSYIKVERNGIRYEIFLGEYLIFERERRLTMLRIEAHPIPGAPVAAAMRSGAALGDSPPPPDPEGSTSILELLINGHKHP